MSERTLDSNSISIAVQNRCRKPGVFNTKFHGLKFSFSPIPPPLSGRKRQRKSLLGKTRTKAWTCAKHISLLVLRHYFQYRPSARHYSPMQKYAECISIFHSPPNDSGSPHFIYFFHRTLLVFPLTSLSVACPRPYSHWRPFCSLHVVPSIALCIGRANDIIAEINSKDRSVQYFYVI